MRDIMRDAWNQELLFFVRGREAQFFFIMRDARQTIPAHLLSVATIMEKVRYFCLQRAAKGRQKSRGTRLTGVKLLQVLHLPVPNHILTAVPYPGFNCFIQLGFDLQTDLQIKQLVIGIIKIIVLHIGLNLFKLFIFQFKK